MDRRALLAGSGTTLSTFLAGRLGDASGSQRTTTGSSSCNEPIHDASDTDRLVSAWSRNDFPPYEVDYPRGAEEADDWNPSYLGDHLATTPSLDFRTRTVSSDWVRERAELPLGNRSYVVRSIGDEDEQEAVLERGDVDFSESTMVLVGECCGSGSVEHRWARVEATAAGVHLYGYLERPWLRNDDLSPRYSLLEIERPGDEVDVACVSLTVEADSRLHFDSADGIVSLVAAVIANDRAEALDVDLQVTTADGETRVDATFTLEANKEWRGIGTIGESDETFTVELRVDALGIDVTEEYPADEGTLGIRIQRDGEAVIGRSNEI